MRVLLFKLNGVPEDEADEVRALLADHGIDFYETDLRGPSAIERSRSLDFPDFVRWQTRDVSHVAREIEQRFPSSPHNPGTVGGEPRWCLEPFARPEHVGRHSPGPWLDPT